jgi:hypothetical protein
LNEVTAPTSHFVNVSIVSSTQSARLPDASLHLLDYLHLFYNQRKRAKLDVNFPARYAVNYRCNSGYNYASIVQTGGNRRANKN